MDKLNKEIPINFSLKKITTEQFAILQDAYNVANQDVEMTVSLKFGLDTEKRLIASFVKIQFEQNNNPFIIIEVANHFGINENSWNNFNKTEKGIIAPQGFITHLVMLTAGTLRGVLHCKTENTEFNKFVLPTINIAEIIKGDLELC